MKAVAVAVTLAMVAGTAPGQSTIKGTDAGAQKSTSKPGSGQKHKAVGTVKKVDPQEGTVGLAHEAIKSLNWPAMTMTFKVQDKALFDSLRVDRKVEVEFEQRGKDYIITSAK